MLSAFSQHIFSILSPSQRQSEQMDHRCHHWYYQRYKPASTELAKNMNDVDAINGQARETGLVYEIPGTISRNINVYLLGHNVEGSISDDDSSRIERSLRGLIGGQRYFMTVGLRGGWVDYQTSAIIRSERTSIRGLSGLLLVYPNTPTGTSSPSKVMNYLSIPFPLALSTSSGKLHIFLQKGLTSNYIPVVNASVLYHHRYPRLIVSVRSRLWARREEFIFCNNICASNKRYRYWGYKTTLRTVRWIYILPLYIHFRG